MKNCSIWIKYSFIILHNYVSHTLQKSRNISGKKRSPILFLCGANNVVEHYRKGIEILNWHPFEGWPTRARPTHPFLQLLVGLPCPVKSALKRTLLQCFNSFSISFYYIITTTYKKIGYLFCLVCISGLLQMWCRLMSVRLWNFKDGGS